MEGIRNYKYKKTPEDRYINNVMKRSVRTVSEKYMAMGRNSQKEDTKVMKKNMKKRAAGAGAVALVAALVLSGTYAWNSISQVAKNENVMYANPGGRLHDDWDGETKMVYVENFTGTKVTETEVEDEEGNVTTVYDIDKDINATSIYARVKLQTYMEFGEDAGKLYDEEGNQLTSEELKERNAKSLVASATIDDTESWSTYLYGENSPFNTYFKMVMANDEADGQKQTVYMPTYNMNKESLMADINGKYNYATGLVEGYQTWTDGTEDDTAKNAYYYKNGAGNAEDPVTDDTIPGTDADYVAVETTHTAKTTLETVKIISMDEWLAYDGETEGQEKTGDYWVYDEDGWAYWANPLEPGEASGPLLNAVKLLNANLGDSAYYYAVNVVGEFASAGDWGDAEAQTGFYKNSITSNALDLLNTVSKNAGADCVNVTAKTDTVTGNAKEITVTPGSTITFSGDVTLQGESISDQNITWTVADGTPAVLTPDEDGNGATMVINEDAEPQVIKVTVTPENNKNAAFIYRVIVSDVADEPIE